MPRPKSRPPRVRVPRARAVRNSILGDHPSPPHPFGITLSSRDGETTTNVPYRALLEREGMRAPAVSAISEMLLRHHASPDAIRRSEQQLDIMRRLGMEPAQLRLGRFPANPSTRKGNFAEIILAEYIVAASGVTLPVYRLRYNPNIEQSMKGDDVLAFDLDAEPVRIVVGEAKFRGASSVAAVREIVDGLLKSYKAGLPISLQFIADRLFEEGHVELGTRVSECAILLARDKLRIDYIGLLLSDSDTVDRVANGTPGGLRHLAMVSFSVDDPDSLVEACYRTLE